MSNLYNLDGIRTELKKELSKNETLLKTLENVSFPTKKDGKPFAIMSKNFDGAKYQPISYAMQPGECELWFGGWDNLSGYIHDTITCYELVKYLKDDTMKAKTQNYQPKQSYLEQVYTFDLEDIKNAIQKKIQYYKDRIESLNQQLKIVDKCFNDFQNGYNKLIAELEQNCNIAGTVGYGGTGNDIFYMIRDTVLSK
jgi:hypothetical protein